MKINRMARKNISLLLFSLGLILIQNAILVSGRTTFLISEFTRQKMTANDVATWNVRNADGDFVTTLGDVTLVGGHGAFGRGAELSKHYRELPDHYKIRVEFLFYGINSWEAETFNVFADGRRVYSLTNTCECHK